MPQFGIIGLGIFLPEKVRTNAWWPDHLVEKFSRKANRPFFAPEFGREQACREDAIQLEEMAKIHGDTFEGTRERRVADERMPTSEMEYLALREAALNSGISPRAIELIVSYACPSDHYLPGNASAVQDKLGCGSNMAFSVDSACASFSTILAVAESLMRTQGFRFAAASISCKFSQLVSQDDHMSILVGDGAVGIMIGPVADTMGFRGHAQEVDGHLRNAVVCGAKSGKSWYRGEEALLAFAPAPEVAREALRGTGVSAKRRIGGLLKRVSTQSQAIDAFYGHQGTAWFNETCRRCADLEHAKTTETFARFGTMGAVNIPLNLWHAVTAGQLCRGDTVVTYGVGMGLSWSASVMTWAV